MTRTQGHLDPRVLGAALARLGYDASWLEAGIIGPREVLEQLGQLGNGPPDMDEHLRHSTMFGYLQRQSAFGNEQWSKVVGLIEREHDRSCGHSLLLDLLSHPGSTDEQFEALAVHPLLEGFSRRVLRARLLRELARQGPSEAWYRAVVASGDAALHRRVTADRDTPRWVFEQLVRAGSNKAVRNVAEERLNMRAFRDS